MHNIVADQHLLFLEKFRFINFEVLRTKNSSFHRVICQLLTGGFCCNIVLLPAGPLLQQPAHYVI